VRKNVGGSRQTTHVGATATAPSAPEFTSALDHPSALDHTSAPNYTSALDHTSAPGSTPAFDHTSYRTTHTRLAAHRHRTIRWRPSTRRRCRRDGNGADLTSAPGHTLALDHT